MSGVIDSISPAITSGVEPFLNDPKIGTVLTVRRYQGITYDSDTGMNKASYEDVNGIRALALAHNEKSVKRAGAGAVLGDKVFIVPFTDMDFRVTLQDVIVDASGQSYKVKGYQPIYSVIHVITVEF